MNSKVLCLKKTTTLQFIEFALIVCKLQLKKLLVRLELGKSYFYIC